MSALTTPASSQSRPHKFINHSPENYEDNSRSTGTDSKQFSMNASPQQRKPLAPLSDNTPSNSELFVKKEENPLQTPALQNGEKTFGGSTTSNVEPAKREDSDETQRERSASTSHTLTYNSANHAVNHTASHGAPHTAAAAHPSNLTVTHPGNHTANMTAASPDRTVCLNIFTPNHSSTSVKPAMPTASLDSQSSAGSCASSASIPNTSTPSSSGCLPAGAATATSSPLVISGSPNPSNRSSPNTSRNNSISHDSTKEYKDPPRKRRRTSPDESQILEYEFARNSRPCKEDRERIAALTSKDEKAVQVWFQNKRQSCRRQQNGCGMVRALVRSISYGDETPGSPNAVPNGMPTATGIIPAMPTQSMPAAMPMSTTQNPSLNGVPPVNVYPPHNGPMATPSSKNSMAAAAVHCHPTSSIPSPIPHASMAYYSWPSPPMQTVLPQAHTTESAPAESRNLGHHQHMNHAHDGDHTANIGASLKSGENQNQNPAETKRSKSLKSSMSADGKAEIVERSPLKVSSSNRSHAPAQRFATMPTFAPLLSGYEQECASSLSVSKSGQW